MLTSFGGIDLGYSGLQANQQALETTGHNIANAGREGYSRQQVIMTSTTPLYGAGFGNPTGIGQFGTGVTVSKIQRIRDVFIDNRIISENKSYGYWDKMADLTHQLELIYNEPSDTGLQSAIDAFWTSLENLTNAEGLSEQAAARSIVIENANTLTSTLSSMYEQMQEIGGNGGYSGQKNAIDYEIYTDIQNINGLAKELAEFKKEKESKQNPSEYLQIPKSKVVLPTPPPFPTMLFNHFPTPVRPTPPPLPTETFKRFVPVVKPRVVFCKPTSVPKTPIQRVFEAQAAKPVVPPRVTPIAKVTPVVFNPKFESSASQANFVKEISDLLALF